MWRKIILSILLVFLASCNDEDSSTSPADSNKSAEVPRAPTPTPPPSTSPQPNPPVASPQAPALVRNDFLSDLQDPWDMAFTDDGTMFYTEKCKGLSARKPDGTIMFLFGVTGANLIAPDFFCEGQSGMTGIALDPGYKKNHTLYVFMSSNMSRPRSNRIIKLVVDTDYGTASERFDIITDIPFKNTENNWGPAGLHSGGRIRFGPDGYLYVTTGDNHDGLLPQDLTKLGGKVLRVDTSGAAAPGNNSISKADPRIFTYGHRNVQGITFHPITGKPFICEHGPNHSDEITVLNAGGNGGWDPAPDAGVKCADNYCGYTSNNLKGTPTAMTDLAKFPAALHPIKVYADSAGLSPCVFLIGSQWKAWNNSLAVGMLAGKRIDILTLDDTGTAVTNTVTAKVPAERMRSLVQGPDGNLYVATDEGVIWKITPR